VRKALLLVCTVMFVAACLGCESQMCRNARRSVAQNTELTVLESVRVVGLDRPSMLHMRDNVPNNYYTPYR
jgi:hypothetical protein